MSFFQARGYASCLQGPVFDELDEGLQREFQAYLEERGITPALGECCLIIRFWMHELWMYGVCFLDVRFLDVLSG
jgi:hypothetical protein